MSLSTLKGMNDSNDASSVEPTMIQGARIQWPGGPAMAQTFSLPSSIIYYIAMNPSNPEVYNKLIKCCKYFYERNPILVAATLTENTICSNDECRGHRECCVKMDIKRITSKIWLTRRLNLYNDTIPTFVELLRPKVYRCDLINLSIGERAVEYKDFKFFTSSVKDIDLVGTKIVFDNGNPVMLENVLEELPNIEIFIWHFENNASIVSASTFKNMSKLKNLGNLKIFCLIKIQENFILNDLFNFIKDHNGIKFRLVFADNISEHYKNQLDQLIDSIIESQLSNGFIYYRGMNEEKFKILFTRAST